MPDKNQQSYKVAHELSNELWKFAKLPLVVCFRIVTLDIFSGNVACGKLNCDLLPYR